MPALVCDCNHPTHAADACTGVVGVKIAGWGATDGGDGEGRCTCDLPPLCEVHAFDRVDNDLLSCAVCGEIKEGAL